MSTIENVALILRDYECESCNLGWKVAQLDTPKVCEWYIGPSVTFIQFLVDFGFDIPHLFVSDDEEVTRAASRIENPNFRRAFAKVKEATRIGTNKPGAAGGESAAPEKPAKTKSKK